MLSGLIKKQGNVKPAINTVIETQKKLLAPKINILHIIEGLFI